MTILLMPWVAAKELTDTRYDHFVDALGCRKILVTLFLFDIFQPIFLRTPPCL